MTPAEALAALWKHARAQGIRVFYRAPIRAVEEGVDGWYLRNVGNEPLIELYRDRAPDPPTDPDLVSQPLHDAILLAHEFGHYLSETKGTRTSGYEAALAAYDRKDQSLTEDEEDLIRREEQLAWANGREVLAELGFQDPMAFDKLELEGMRGYEKRFELRRIREARRQRLGSLANHISKVEWNFETVGIAGYLAGACFALRSALDHTPTPIVDAHFRVDPQYAQALELVCRELWANGDPTEPNWLDGFHFHSALHRIAAATDRIPLVKKGMGEREHLESKERREFWSSPTLDRIYEQVNSLKHRRAGSGVELQDTPLVTVEDAIAGLELLITRAVEFWPRDEGV